MLLTARKSQKRERRWFRKCVLDAIEDHLPIWRFVHERCYSCGWEGDGLVPFDVTEFDRTACECLSCGEMTARVVGVRGAMQAMTLVEARRAYSELRDNDELPPFLPLIKALDKGETSQRGVQYLV